MTSGVEDCFSTFGGAAHPAFFGDSAMIVVRVLDDVEVTGLALNLTMSFGFSAAMCGVVCGDSSSREPRARREG